MAFLNKIIPHIHAWRLVSQMILDPVKITHYNVKHVLTTQGLRLLRVFESVLWRHLLFIYPFIFETRSCCASLVRLEHFEFAAIILPLPFKCWDYM